MKSLIRFWKEDILNKLIVVVTIGLLVGAVVVAYVLITLLPQTQLQQSDALPTGVAIQPTDTHAPTPTTAFIVNATAAVLPIGGLVPTAASTDAATPTAEATGSPALPPTLSAACIPSHAAETGKVIAVVDGDTIRVYMEDKVYFVRYIGIDVPSDGEVKQLYGPAATFTNSSLVYGKQVTLIQDVSGKDPVGHLLRYVMVGSTFVNLEMVRSGMATAANVPPNTACAQEFKLAEQGARQAQVGRWAGTPTPFPTVP